jgi:hypothetical protein
MSVQRPAKTTVRTLLLVIAVIAVTLGFVIGILRRSPEWKEAEARKMGYVNYAEMQEAE